MSDRRKLLAKIHIAIKYAKVCKMCGAVLFFKKCPVCGSDNFRAMSEIDYRRFLKDATGKTSCRDMTDEELVKVMKQFYKFGYKPGLIKNKMIYKIKEEAITKFGNNWAKRIEGFISKRIKKNKLEECNIKDLRHVWAFLRKCKGV